MAHQRTLDKTKDAIRKQLECGLSSNGAGYPGSGYPGGGDYASSSGAAANGPVVTPDNNGDYCAVSDFADGQKWHPYQVIIVVVPPPFLRAAGVIDSARMWGARACD